MSNVCAQMQFPLQNLVQYIRIDLEIPVDLGKGTDIWSFYMDVDFCGLRTFTCIKYVIKVGPHNVLFLQCSEYKYRTF